jgi:rhodanese-related sulfurtransferase
MVFGKTIKEIIILTGISVTLAMVVNYISPKGIALVGQWDTSKGVITASPTGPGNYEDGHISGAESLPVGQFDEQIESFLNRHSPDTRIVTYCSGRTCEDSHNLARFLSDVGFTHVSVFIDGFPGWEAQGFPIE